MPWGLKRFQQARDLHFITFSCYRRQPKLGDAARRRVFEQALERVRKQCQFFIRGYVVMPEHVHLLISEPEDGLVSRALQSLKQGVSRKLALRDAQPFWQERYYDFNVYSEAKGGSQSPPIMSTLTNPDSPWVQVAYRVIPIP